MKNIESATGSILRHEGKTVVFKCIIEPKLENYGENQIAWE